MKVYLSRRETIAKAKRLQFKNQSWTLPRILIKRTFKQTISTSLNWVLRLLQMKLLKKAYCQRSNPYFHLVFQMLLRAHYQNQIKKACKRINQHLMVIKNMQKINLKSWILSKISKSTRNLAGQIHIQWHQKVSLWTVGLKMGLKVNYLSSRKFSTNYWLILTTSTALIVVSYYDF